MISIACCGLLAARGPARGQFVEGPALLQGTLLEGPLVEGPIRLPPPEEIAPGPGAPADEHKVILDEPGWHVWSPVYWDPWEGNVELGLSGTEGNSETFNVRFGMTARHKTETFAQTLQVTSIQKSAGGVTTANTALVDGRLEWPMPQSRWNYFIHGLWEYDEFKAFQYRVSGDTGLGFELIQTEATMLMARSGLSVSHEVGGPEDAWSPSCSWAASSSTSSTPRTRSAASSTTTPRHCVERLPPQQPGLLGDRPLSILGAEPEALRDRPLRQHARRCPAERPGLFDAALVDVLDRRCAAPPAAG